MGEHNHQKKIAVINDLSGFGRSSLSVQIPVISAMHIQCCPVPTAIFTCHTGFHDFHFMDNTEGMKNTIHDWKSIDLQFEGISTGYLGEAKQIDLVIEFLKAFKTEKTTILVDPVMGDYGKLYPSYSEELANRIKELVPYADVLTPNLTEACILTNREYTRTPNTDELKAIVKELHALGPKKIVISGLEDDYSLENFVSEEGHEPIFIHTDRVGKNRSGTGDVFSSVILGSLVRGYSFRESVQKAVNFIHDTLVTTKEMNIPLTDGICIEEHLQDLA